MMQTGVRPKPSTFQIWWLASRPNTLPAAIVPVLVGAALAAHDGHTNPVTFVATLLASLLIQIGTNLANDLFDFEKGADTGERIGPPRITSAGWVTPAGVRRAMIGVFAAATLLGLYLVAVGGWPILVVGILSIICAVAYTGGPWPLGYHGLGEVFVFLFFGVVAVAGTYYVLAGTVTPLALLVSVPVGLLCTAIIVVNNIRDIDTDRKAGKRTLAVRIGRPATRALYTACIAVSYLIVLAIWPLVGRTWAALPVLTVGLAVTPVMTIWRETSGPPLIGVLKSTARLHLIFGVLLALGILWDGFR